MKKILLIFFVCLAYLSSAQNVSYSTLYDESSFNAKTINTTLAVGSTSGTGGVSSGAASYTIPIAIPAGTNGVVPTLSINYSSLGGNGQLGKGWGISGLSKITASNDQNLYYDGEALDYLYRRYFERFYLDGKRLILKTGKHPERTNFSDTNSTYTTDDNQFNIVTLVRQTDGYTISYFQVKTSDGIIMEYGNTADSKVNDFEWLLNKIIYPNGNYIQYIYNNTNGETRIEEIKYTGNEQQGLSPYNSIKFEYLQRNDKNTTYYQGYTMQANVLLDNITIKTNNLYFKKYTLAYGFNNNTSYLNEIKEIGITNGLNGSFSENPLNSTIFKYDDDVQSITKKTTDFVKDDKTITKFETGDFNGDGYGDMLTPMYDSQSGEVNGFRVYASLFKSTPQTLSLCGEVTGITLNSFISNQSKKAPQLGLGLRDFNGDGTDDIILTNLGINASFVSNFSVYESHYNPSASGNQRITFTNRTIAIANKDYVQMPNNGQYLHLGDFNGDGISDVLTILRKPLSTGYKLELHIEGSTAPVTITSFYDPYSSYYYSINDLALSENISVIDFNGDGRNDLLFNKGDKYYVFGFEKNLNSSTNEQIYYCRLLFKPYYLGEEPTLYPSNYPTYFGDFNGDRKTDILIRTSSEDNNASWKVLYSNGNRFVAETPFSFSVSPYLKANNEFSKHSVLIGDYNGDGLADICHLRTKNLSMKGELIFDIYYSTGSGFTLKTFTDVGHGELTTDFPSLDGRFPQNVYDYNGDGKSDILIPISPSIPIDMFSFSDNGKGGLLQKVKNGVGHITEWDYKNLNQDNSFYSTSGTKSYPLNAIKAPLKLVSDFKVSNGINGTATKTYSYQNAILHRAGKGFLGFEKITTSDALTDTKIVSENTINTSFYLLLPQKETITTLSNSNVLSTSTSVISIKDLTNKQYRIEEESNEQINYFEKKVSATSNVFDTNGQIEKSITSIYGGTTATDSKLNEKVTTETIFGLFGGTVANKPTNVKVTKLRKEGTNEFTSTETKKFGYNNYGELTSKVDFFGLAKSISTEYIRDGFGNITKTTATPSGMDPRSASDVYDSKGRFITERTNELGQKSTTTYDAVFGQPSSITGIDGLTTSFEYDAFGRLTKTTVPEGYNILQSLGWISTNSYLYSVYYSIVDHPHRPNVKTYYDLLGRDLITEKEGFDGKTVFTYKKYDSRGNVANSSLEPYYADEDGINVTNTYDIYNRLTLSGSPIGTTSIAYSYDENGMMTITTTDPANKITKKVNDPSGKTVESVDNGATQYYSYNAQGNLLSVKNSDGVVLTTSIYDEYGKQTSLTDLSAGTISYLYNAAGELTSETNAKNETHTMEYDNAGRLKTRIGPAPEGTTSTEYYATVNSASVNKVKKVTGFNGETSEFTYDSFGRLFTKTITVDGTAYTTTYTYTTGGDIESQTYPSNFKINNAYDNNGYLKTIKNGDNTKTLYTHTAENALGQVTNYSLGNGKASTVNYTYGVPTQFFTAGLQNLLLTWEFTTGNLLKREDKAKEDEAKNNITETFTYDTLDRLLTTQVNNKATVTMTYQSSGNIDTKTGVGTYAYDANKKYAVTSVTNPNAVIPSFNQEISFTSYERPATISENGYVLNYTYGADYERIKAVMSQNGSNRYTRYYLGDYEKSIDNNTTREIHYISSPAGLIAIVERENGSSTDNYHYTYTDHLGSILTVTSATGTVEAEQSFDAWGRRRNPNTWDLLAPTAATGLPAWLYRGYTGHEHLDEFGIINMNARLYDPVLGRMISPDNFVNGVFDSQGYNRYSYARNNPLKYVDPDGNFAFLAVASFIVKGALISAAANATIQVVQNGGFNNFNWGSVGMAALQGGIGAGFANIIGDLGLSGLANIKAHAISGGIQSAIFGGDFGSGMISGGVGSYLGSLTAGTDAGLVGSFAISGTISAVTARLTGGDPFQAFITGGTVAAFNHFLHGPKPKRSPKVSIYVWEKEQGGDVGHTAIRIGDTIYGYYPGDENGQPGYQSDELFWSKGEMNIDNISDFTKKYKGGRIESFELNLSRGQTILLENKLKSYVKNPGHYSLLGQQCTSVACGSLQSVGVKIYDSHPLNGLQSLNTWQLSPQKFQNTLMLQQNSSLVKSMFGFIVK